MENNDRYIKIERFLDGALPPDEQKIFREEVANNEGLAEEVALQRLQRLMGAQMMDNYIEDKLAEWQQDDGQKENPGTILPGTNTEKKNRGYRWLLMLLPILVAGACCFFWSTPPGGQTQSLEEPKKEVPAPPPTDQEKETETPAENNGAPSGQAAEQPPKKLPPPNQPIAQKAPSEAEAQAILTEYDLKMDYILHGARGAADNLAKAERARNAGDFDRAILLYDKVSKQESNEGVEAAFNLGLLYFEQKEFKEAIPYFEKAANSNDFLYDNDARYYLALCHLACRQFEEMKSSLGILENQPNYRNHDKVKDLINWARGFK